MRYFYEGAYREVWIPVGGRVALTVPMVGLPVHRGVGHYILTGDFCGGSYVAPVGHLGPPPPSWRPPPPPVTYTNRTVVPKPNRPCGSTR